MVEAKRILKIEGISKCYGGLHALDSVSLDICYGETHALIGENGAGKSTLMKIIGGIVKKDTGRIEFEGSETNFHSPQDALQAGISIIHQELSMLPELNIIENVYMGRMKTRAGRIDWKLLEKLTRQQLEKVGLTLDPHTIVKSLSMSQKQLVEIAKALSVNAKLIVMDEPTSSLCDVETERLFDVIQDLKRQNISIIYISHKLNEVITISDRISVLKDGRFVETIPGKGATPEKMVQLMVGRDLVRQHTDRRIPGPVRLRVTGLSGQRFRNVSFDLHEGEVLGFAGLVGAGRSEVARAIFGADPSTSGTMELGGAAYKVKSPSDAIRSGIAMVAEDRKAQSLFLDLSIRANMSIVHLPKLTVRGRIQENKIQELVKNYQNRLKIKMISDSHPVKSLSGGNQQKTILGRWLATDPRILILDEPTHGIDVGAKSEIYRLIQDLAKEGMSIILISSELPEIIAMCDRVIVMNEGTIKSILKWDEVTEENIMSCAAGINAVSCDK